MANRGKKAEPVDRVGRAREAFEALSADERRSLLEEFSCGSAESEAPPAFERIAAADVSLTAIRADVGMLAGRSEFGVRRGNNDLQHAAYLLRFLSSQLSPKASEPGKDLLRKLGRSARHFSEQANQGPRKTTSEKLRVLRVVDRGLKKDPVMCDNEASRLGLAREFISVVMASPLRSITKLPIPLDDKGLREYDFDAAARKVSNEFRLALSEKPYRENSENSLAARECMKRGLRALGADKKSTTEILRFLEQREARGSAP